jgi:hypothetical protein
MAFTLSERSLQVPATPCRGLAAELALRCDRAGHARRFRADEVRAVHHRVHDCRCAKIRRATHGLDLGFIVSAGRPWPGTDHARHFPGRLHHVADQVIDHVDVGGPRAGRVRQLGPVPGLALFADNVAEAFDFIARVLTELDHIIERVGNFAVESS